MDKKSWFADFGAIEHMIEHREWFSSFKPIPPGTWSVAIADDQDLWVQDIGDIEITCTIDGTKKKGVLKNVLFILELGINLFSIGLASKSGLSFRTMGDRCELYHDFGKGPKVMEGIRIGILYKLSINPLVLINYHPHVDDNNDSSVDFVTTKGHSDSFAAFVTTKGHSDCSTALVATKDNNDSSTVVVTTKGNDAHITLWHNRMGYINVQVMNHMSKYNTLFFLCETIFLMFAQVVPLANNTKQHIM